MLVLAVDRDGKILDVGYLPDRGSIEVGRNGHLRVDIPERVLMRREGTNIYLHLPNGVMEVKDSVNLTNVVINVVNIEREYEYDRLWRLESELFREDLSERARRFIRLYTALSALKLAEKENSYTDSLLLLASRLLNIEVNRLSAEREKIVEQLRKEIDSTLKEMKKDELVKMLGVLIG